MARTPAHETAASPRPTDDTAPKVLPEPAALKPSLLPPAAPRGAEGNPLAAVGTADRALPAQPVAAPAVPAAPPTPPTAPVAQVEGSLRWMLKGGAQEASLQLHPDSLGQVTIHLRVQGGEVHARLWVTEPASVQAVQEGRPHLEQSLRDQGLQLGSFDLHQGHRPPQDAPWTPAARGVPAVELPFTRQEAPALPLTTSLNPHHVELYA